MCPVMACELVARHIREMRFQASSRLADRGRLRRPAPTTRSARQPRSPSAVRGHQRWQRHRRSFRFGATGALQSGRNCGHARVSAASLPGFARRRRFRRFGRGHRRLKQGDAFDQRLAERSGGTGWQGLPLQHRLVRVTAPDPGLASQDHQPFFRLVAVHLNPGLLDAEPCPQFGAVGLGPGRAPGPARRLDTIQHRLAQRRIPHPPPDR
jgi:hypothetical protein